MRLVTRVSLEMPTFAEQSKFPQRSQQVDFGLDGWRSVMGTSSVLGQAAPLSGWLSARRSHAAVLAGAPAVAAVPPKMPPSKKAMDGDVSSRAGDSDASRAPMGAALRAKPGAAQRAIVGDPNVSIMGSAVGLWAAWGRGLRLSLPAPM